MTLIDAIYEKWSEFEGLFDRYPRESFQAIRTTLNFGNRVESFDVPLITCKDCDHCTKYHGGVGDTQVVFYGCEYEYGVDTPIGERVVDPDSFCCWAEPREDA